jgi:predicted ATPase/Flp pilus assembly protein TadD
VHLIELGQAVDGARMLDTVAAVVGASDRHDGLDAALAGGRRLLLIDGIEHLRDGWPLLGDLLGRHPELTLLTTSRERLHLRDEWVLPLSGLAVPDPALPPAEASYYGALRLFQERARRARPEFSLDGEALPAVVEICRLLGGSPLGIELAAGWVRALSSATLLSELRRSIDLLDDPSADGERRSARTVFERSWALLDAPGQRALRRLSLFRAGFRHDAAVAVAEITSRDLARLIDGSLLTLDGNGRYRQHPLVREFAFEHLTDVEGELDRVRERHADYHIDLLRHDGPELRAARQGAVVERLALEIDNLELAWSFVLDRGEIERLSEIAPAIGFLYDLRGLPQRGFELLSTTLQRLDPPSAPAPRALARLRLSRGGMATRIGRPEVTLRMAERTLEDREHLDDSTLAEAYQHLGSATHDLGDLEGAVHHTEHALTLMVEPSGRARIGANLAVMTQALGDFARAEPLYREAIERFAEVGNIAAAVHTQGNLGSLLLSLERPREAIATLQRAIELADGIAYLGAVPLLRHNLAAAHVKLGDLDSAETEIRASIEAARASHQERFVRGGTAMLANIVRLGGDPVASADLALTALRESWQAHDLAGVTTALLRIGEASLDRGDPLTARRTLTQVRDHPATLAWVRVASERALEGLAATETEGDPDGLERLVAQTLARAERPL